jgi:dienelactone hydrolase
MVFRLIFLLILLPLTWLGTAKAQQQITFPSSGDPTILTGYLLRPSGTGPYPALVFLHGCGGMFEHGGFMLRDITWAHLMVNQGYVVLMVDSDSPRHQGQMCVHTTFNPTVYQARFHDAYGALGYLQGQSFVIPNRIGVIGWSEGGGVVLYSIREVSANGARPANLPTSRDFRAAVAFYLAIAMTTPMRCHG